MSRLETVCQQITWKVSDRATGDLLGWVQWLKSTDLYLAVPKGRRLASQRARTFVTLHDAQQHLVGGPRRERVAS